MKKNHRITIDCDCVLIVYYTYTILYFCVGRFLVIINLMQFSQTKKKLSSLPVEIAVINFELLDVNILSLGATNAKHVKLTKIQLA